MLFRSRRWMRRSDIKSLFGKGKDVAWGQKTQREKDAGEKR